MPIDAASSSRARAPVFTVGSPRSGTTLLYHMLLSAGGFARYRAETHLFSSLGARFGGLATEKDRHAALEVWLGSALHRLTALPDADVRALMLGECRCTGDFLRLLMEALVRRQGATRWAETTPAHLQYMREIKAQIPEALFVHVVRDGRDVAASLSRLGWLYAYPFDRDRPALPAAAYWDWLVRRGRAEGESLGGDYLEVHYEALVQEPQATLERLGAFIGQRLDYETIQRTAVGSVARPNTSFPGATGGFQGRWRTELSAEDGAAVDALLGDTLPMFGYERAGNGSGASLVARRVLYAARFAVRDWTKRWTPLARLATDLSLYAPHATPVTDEKLAGV